MHGLPGHGPGQIPGHCIRRGPPYLGQLHRQRPTRDHRSRYSEPAHITYTPWPLRLDRPRPPALLNDQGACSLVDWTEPSMLKV